MSDPLAYATPEYRPVKPTSVGFRLGLLGLGLIFLSGCFMIGILLVQFSRDNRGVPLYATTPGATFFTLLLYAFAITCFVGGAYVLAQGVKKLTAS